MPSLPLNSASRTARDIPQLNNSEIERFSKLILERCGLFFSDGRRPELELGIRHAFASSTCATLDEFYDRLQNPATAGIDMDMLINAVTVSETHFFRDTAQFNALYNHVLPQIIERKKLTRIIRVWSAGCASGEEPYSLAIMFRELLPDIESWSVSIMATDINLASIDRARTAKFGSWAFREERAKQMRERYFQPVENNRFALNPAIRSMVTFRKLNLAEPSYPSYETNTMMMDLIICRNVTIYFPEAVTRGVVDRFYSALVDGGWLVVGHSEPSIDVYRRFQVRNFPDTILYQRTNQPDTIFAPDLTAPPPAFPNIPPAQPASFVQPASLFLATSASPAQVLPASAPKTQNLMAHAEELMEYDRSEDALAVLLQYIKLSPRDARACAMLGQAYANMGNWAESEVWCHKAIDNDKLLLDAYYTLALVNQHQRKLDQAVEMMKKVVYLDRNYVLGHFGLATLYYDQSLLPQAIKSLDNAMRLLAGKPDDSIVAGSKGITAGRLREAIARQQQDWAKSA